MSVSDSTDVRMVHSVSVFFFQAEDGIRDLVRSRGLGDVYKRQVTVHPFPLLDICVFFSCQLLKDPARKTSFASSYPCLLYTSDAADERSSVDLGGRRIIKKKTTRQHYVTPLRHETKHHGTAHNSRYTT